VFDLRRRTLEVREDVDDCTESPFRMEGNCSHRRAAGGQRIGPEGLFDICLNAQSDVLRSG
jgi:hypothetical protein